MGRPPTAVVTPQGVRDGDPAALSALTERRGSAVLAYARAVAAPGRDVEAAADAFARFRLTVVDAEDPMRVHPERTLLGSVRAAAAARAPVPRRAALLGRRGADRVCALIPELLAARAERTLTAADAVRLDRHLERCAACREAESRFHAGERAYREAPDTPVAQPVAREIMKALLAVVAPVSPEPEPAPVIEPEQEPAAQIGSEPFVALDPETEIHAAALTGDDADEDAEAPGQQTLVHGMPRLSARPATSELDAPDLDGLEARPGPRAEFPSFFAARTRPPQPAHPGLRFGAPAGVALLGLIVALAVAGLFGSSDPSSATVSPAAAAVSTPLPDAPAVSPAPRRKAKRTTTTATSAAPPSPSPTATTGAARAAAPTATTAAAPSSAAATPASPQPAG